MDELLHLFITIFHLLPLSLFSLLTSILFLPFVNLSTLYDSISSLTTYTFFQSLQYRQILFYCALLYCTSQIRVFYKLNYHRNHILSHSMRAIFLKAFAHSVSVSHFGNCFNISNTSAVIILAMVITDYNSLKAQITFFSNNVVFS